MHGFCKSWINSKINKTQKMFRSNIPKYGKLKAKLNL